MLANHTGKTADQIGSDTDRDFFLNAEQAKEYGLVDDILIKPPSEMDDDD
ncbi:MAG: ATP-dependent Clp protease proteolytic subunit [Planctomycetota bacterium]